MSGSEKQADGLIVPATPYATINFPTATPARNCVGSGLFPHLHDKLDSGAKIATGRNQVPAAIVQAAIWNSPAMKVA
jgi:hypothetical protein